MFYHQLRAELWKLFGKKRTYIGFAMFLATQAFIILWLRFRPSHRLELAHRLELMGYTPDQFITAMTISLIMIIPMAVLLLPLYATLIGGDLVAKEAEDGTLRMILSRPVSRLRLLTVKWLAGAIFSIVLTVALGAFGLGFASLFFPNGGLFFFLPQEQLFSVFGPAEAWQRYAGAISMLILTTVTMTGLAWMFSCFNIKPAAATILAISFLFMFRILQELEFFKELQPFMITYHFRIWLDMLREPIPWWKVGESISILAAYNVTFFVIGTGAFQTRDIKS
ncbi:MAG: putative rane protein [Verrucomicrobiales bacterium]|nr:putative rane protein [Verrucomicrobiales bacterium]